MEVQSYSVDGGIEEESTGLRTTLHHPDYLSLLLQIGIVDDKLKF